MSHYRGVEKSSVNTQLKKPTTKIVIEHCFTKRVLHGASSYSVLIQVIISQSTPDTPTYSYWRGP